MPRRSMSPSTLAADAVQLDPAGRGDVAQTCHQAGGQRVEQQLGRRRAEVGAYENRGVVGLDDGVSGVDVLLAGAEEAGKRAAGVVARDPFVDRAELELGGLGLLAHRVDGGEQRGGVDAVEVLVSCDGHGSAFRDGEWLMRRNCWWVRDRVSRPVLRRRGRAGPRAARASTSSARLSSTCSSANRWGGGNAASARVIRNVSRIASSRWCS